MERVKIKLSCVCGESFVLRGSFNGNSFETGFQKCVCGKADASNFKIEILEQYQAQVMVE